MWPIPPYRHAMPPPQSDAIGTSRTACTTPAMSRSRRISPVSVTTPASSPGCAPSPTTSCVAIRLQRSIRIATPPLSAGSTHSSSGASVKSVEQPWFVCEVLPHEDCAIVACHHCGNGRSQSGTRADTRFVQILHHRSSSAAEAKPANQQMREDTIDAPLAPKLVLYSTLISSSLCVATRWGISDREAG